MPSGEDRLDGPEDEFKALEAGIEKRDAELRALRLEFRRARERARGLEDSRRAMLYMLEDLNESTAKVKEEAEVSSSLLNIFEALNTSLDERELIRNVTKLAPRYLKFDRIGIFFYDEELKGFTFSGGCGLSPAEEGFLISKTFRKGDMGAIDELLKGKTLILKPGHDTELLSRELVDGLNLSSFVAVPIRFRGKITGGIVGDYKTGKTISQKDIALLKGLADGIAVAFQNSRLYKESIERLMELTGKVETIKTMAHLGREILSTIDRDTILNTATALINRLIPCERATVILKEGDICRIVSEWGHGEFKEKTYPFTGCRCESVEGGRSSLYLPDISTDACPYHRDLCDIGIQAVLMVPLVAKGEVIGFLDIASTYHGRLTPAHLTTAENVASQITIALENARLYEDLGQLLINTIASLASAIDAKSSWTKGHSERVTRYAMVIGRELGLSERELEDLRLSGLLHDVGKIGTFDVLLDKPGRLTNEEFALVKQHPVKGAEILSPIKQLGPIIPGILYHHESYDGRGYPKGLKGEEIPLQARILCVADAFDSMTADRPYRSAPGKAFAISEFKRCSGTQFDPKVVEAFLRVLDKESLIQG